MSKIGFLDLVKYCKSIDINCSKCEYKLTCNNIIDNIGEDYSLVTIYNMVTKDMIFKDLDHIEAVVEKKEN